MNKINEYVVIDTETTGFSPKWCKIIEVCASKVKDGKIVETFTTLINPDIQISEFISDITGITDDMVYDKPKFYEIADQFKSFIGQNTIVGHNVCFDIRFLNAELGEELSNDTIDTRFLAKELCPDLESYRLESLCKQFGLCDKQHHRAESDVNLTYRLFEYLSNM